MSKGGNRKGSPFEREVCKKLSLWWTNNERDDIFYRSSSSGARATNRSKKGQSTVNSHGDIAALDPIGLPFLKMFTVEVKRGYSKFSIQDLIDKPDRSKKQKYEEWIEQARRSAKEANSFSWLIILKRDRRESLVIVPYIHGLQIATSVDTHLVFNDGRNNELFVFILEEFLKWNPNYLKRLVDSIAKMENSS